MKNLVSIVICLFCFSSTALAQAVFGNVRIEKVRSFSTKDLWNSSKSSTVHSKDTSMMFRNLDQEVVGQKSGWYPCSLIMIGNGDLGITPFSFKLWTKRACRLEIVAISSIDSNDSIYLLKLEDEKPLEIRVAQNQTISIAGRGIGQIKMPQ